MYLKSVKYTAGDQDVCKGHFVHVNALLYRPYSIPLTLKVHAAFTSCLLIYAPHANTYLCGKSDR